ncbi:MAG TPA: hypothetical protein VMS43_01870 [Allosphingosinicella sp.]|nr:hypothetical protein [Allosphingosinicella sp.]
MRLKLLTLAAAALAAAAFAPSLAAQPARGAAAACALSLPAEADNASFDDAGRASGAERARLVQATGANFAAAASRLCGAGVVRAAHLRPYSRLLVRNAEGATEPKVYDDAEELPGALIIEYVFESAAPTQAGIEAALRCWRNPQAAGCQIEDIGP